MRYIVYGVILLAGVLAATVATGRLPRMAVASHDGAAVDAAINATVDVPKLRETDAVAIRGSWPVAIVATSRQGQNH